MTKWEFCGLIQPWQFLLEGSRSATRLTPCHEMPEQYQKRQQEIGSVAVDLWSSAAEGWQSMTGETVVTAAAEGYPLPDPAQSLILMARAGGSRSGI